MGWYYSYLFALLMDEPESVIVFFINEVNVTIQIYRNNTSFVTFSDVYYCLNNSMIRL